MNKLWFDRKFDFNPGPADFDAIVERLRTAPATVARLVDGVDNDIMIGKPSGKWSVKEHIGHLALLESLWFKRLLDIRDGRPELTPTDLANTATDEAQFNHYQVRELTERFQGERKNLLDLIAETDLRSITSKSLHPRLKKNFGVIDHIYFVAEHDLHHIEYIEHLVNNQKLPAL